MGWSPPTVGAGTAPRVVETENQQPVGTTPSYTTHPFASRERCPSSAPEVQI